MSIDKSHLLIASAGPAGYSPLWLTGSGVPSSGLGSNNDMYLDSATGNVYGPKAAGVWGSIVANIKGPTGSNASAVIWRGNYAGGTTYAQGDGVTDTSNNHLYVSLVAANVGHTPNSSPTYWVDLSAATSIAGSTRAKVFTNSVQTIADSTWTALAFDLETYDVGVMHDPVTNNDRITIPTGADGGYILRASVTLQTNGTGLRQLAIWKNTGSNPALQLVQHQVAALPSGTYVELTVTSEPVPLVAGDYVRAMVWHNAGVSQNTFASELNTSFSATRIW